MKEVKGLSKWEKLVDSILNGDKSLSFDELSRALEKIVKRNRRHVMKMIKDLQYYMAQPYRIEITGDKESGEFIVSCPELKGCLTVAETVAEGINMIEDAKREWFLACIEDGIEIPEPVTDDDYSGQFKLRLPKSLHRTLAQHAREEGVSMNQYCVYLLSKQA